MEVGRRWERLRDDESLCDPFCISSIKIDILHFLSKLLDCINATCRVGREKNEDVHFLSKWRVSGPFIFVGNLESNSEELEKDGTSSNIYT